VSGFALLSLGSNEQPERFLRAAVDELRARFGEVVVSPVYRTPAVGFDGPDFLNCAAAIRSDLEPQALNDWLHALEDRHGRRRDVPRFSSRTLDVDIVYFDDRVMRGEGNLQLPRPELKHAFVLKPLADIAPDFVDPVQGRTLAALWAAHPESASPPAVDALDLG
jgi:2-amino-4-hydroxy-6-hydroxymethyldihydropteridine diphosphokinase